MQFKFINFILVMLVLSSLTYLSGVYAAPNALNGHVFCRCVWGLFVRRLAALLLPFPVDASIKSWHSARARMFLARSHSSHALQDAVARHAP